MWLQVDMTMTLPRLTTCTGVPFSFAATLFTLRAKMCVSSSWEQFLVRLKDRTQVHWGLQPIVCTLPQAPPTCAHGSL